MIGHWLQSIAKGRKESDLAICHTYVLIALTLIDLQIQGFTNERHG